MTSEREQTLLAACGTRNVAMDRAEQDLADAITEARAEKISWARIAAAIDVAPQSAWKRWKGWGWNAQAGHAERRPYVPDTEELELGG